jgi:hypothetical protein
VANAEDPVASYLAAALLRNKAGVRAAKLDEQARKALAAWKHVPAWPPERFIAWLGAAD